VPARVLRVNPKVLLLNTGRYFLFLPFLVFRPFPFCSDSPRYFFFYSASERTSPQIVFLLSVPLPYYEKTSPCVFVRLSTQPFQIDFFGFSPLAPPSFPTLFSRVVQPSSFSPLHYSPLKLRTSHFFSMAFFLVSLPAVFPFIPSSPVLARRAIHPGPFLFLFKFPPLLFLSQVFFF